MKVATTMLGYQKTSTDSYHQTAYNVCAMSRMVKPVLYLRSNVKIMNDEQDGSEIKPYNLQQIL